MEPLTESALAAVPAPAARTRRSPRIETDARLDVLTAREVRLDHRVENINLDGVAIETTALEPVGTRVELTIHFPELDAAVETAGEVVWTREAPSPQMGLRFLDMSGPDRALLGRYLYLRAHRP